MACLLELVQLCTGASLIPDLLMVDQHLKQSLGEGGELVTTIVIQSMHFLSDKSVNCDVSSSAKPLFS